MSNKEQINKDSGWNWRMAMFLTSFPFIFGAGFAFNKLISPQNVNECGPSQDGVEQVQVYDEVKGDNICRPVSKSYSTHFSTVPQYPRLNYGKELPPNDSINNPKVNWHALSEEKKREIKRSLTSNSIPTSFPQIPSRKIPSKPSIFIYHRKELA